MSSMTRDIENYKRWKREWYAKNRDKEVARKVEYNNSKRGREVLYSSIKRYREKYPEKLRARQIVQYHIRKGLIKKEPCKCGIEDVQAHHHDYSKPLEVTWLCTTCHGLEHRK